MSAIPNKRRAVNFGSPILSPVLDGLIPVCFSCMTGEDGNLFGFRQVAPFPNDCGRQRLAAFDINRRPSLPLVWAVVAIPLDRPGLPV